MKVSELEGPLLDYWVARAIGGVRHSTDRPLVVDFPDGARVICGTPSLNGFCPSTDWSHGAPLLAEHEVMVCRDEGARTQWYADAGGWMSHDYVQGLPRSVMGRTYLEAGMRAIVASKFGMEVSDDEDSR